jgi:uncharacterized cupin superfamily protein
MTNSMMTSMVATVELEHDPISPDWILSGSPEARNKLLARSEDRTSSIFVWECTPGIFSWHYMQDETAVIVSGEVFITPESGQERRLGPGDMAFFPAGCSARWRVTSKVRKVAVLRSAMPMPLALVQRTWNKLLKMIMRLKGRRAIFCVYY